MPILLALLYIASCFISIDGCPKEDVPPCTCSTNGPTSAFMTCENVGSIYDLRAAINNVRDFSSYSPDVVETGDFQPPKIRKLHIFNATLSYLPHDLLQDIIVENVAIVDSSFMSLSDTDTAFEGQEQSLVSINIQDSHFLDSWNWVQFRHLSKLQEFQTMNCGLQFVEEDIRELSYSSIKSLLLNFDSISYIHETAFAPFKKLSVLSLKRNHIEVLHRSMFPDNLAVIILSNNWIKMLPRDLFAGMPHLKKVALADNELFTLDIAAFGKTWDQLQQLNILGNPIRCDCRMRWIVTATLPPELFAQCEMPKAFKRWKFWDMDLHHLGC